jgi:hypothetical protein
MEEIIDKILVSPLAILCLIIIILLLIISVMKGFSKLTFISIFLFCVLFGYLHLLEEMNVILPVSPANDEIRNVETEENASLEINSSLSLNSSLTKDEPRLDQNISLKTNNEGMLFGGFRFWTNKSGIQIEAKFIKFNDKKILIRRKDGFTFTLNPSTLSQSDLDYLKGLEKHRDQTGRLWHKGNYQQELIRQKWFDRTPDSPSCKFFDFQTEKIDLDGDGRMDGYKVRIFYRVNKHFLRPNAWEMDKEGIVTMKSFTGTRIHQGKYKYSFTQKSFRKIQGYGPSQFIRAESN